MEEEEVAPQLSRKELRKQKLMEYLAAKGKLKSSKSKTNPNKHDRDGKSTVPAKIVSGKENRVPPREILSSSKPPAWIPQPSHNPPRRAFGVSNSRNIQSSKTSRIPKDPSSRDSAAMKPKANAALTQTYTLTSAQFSRPTNQTNAGVYRASSNLPCVVGAKPKPKSTQCLAAAASLCSRGSTSIRVSVGQCIKTRTGLIPALIQPRDETTKPTNFSAQKTKVTAKKPPSVSILPKPLTCSSTGRAESKLQGSFRSQPKAAATAMPRNTQPVRKSNIASGPRLMSQCTKGRSECFKKPEKTALTKKSTSQTDNRFLDTKSVAERKKESQAGKVVPPRIENSFRDCGKTKAVGQRVDTKEKNQIKGFRTQAPSKPPGAYQTASQLPKIITPAAWNGGVGVGTKTSKVTMKVNVQSEGKRQTTAQEERMRKLQEWREAKGISYKRPPMPVKAAAKRSPPSSVPRPFWASMEAEDEVETLVCTVERSLSDCIKLLAEGCPADQVRDVLLRLPPFSQKFSKYWICRVRLMEREGELDVLPVFQEAVRVVLEPVDELRTVVFDILKKKDGLQGTEDPVVEEASGDPASTELPPWADVSRDPCATPRPMRALISEEKGGSSVVKYKITATPGGLCSQQKDPVRVNGQEVRFFTPVRRSVRIERIALRYPASLQEHDPCVTSYRDLISEEDGGTPKGGEASPPTATADTPMYVYRENEALKDKVFVQLVCDDSP